VCILKTATIHAFPYGGVRELPRQVADYLAAYNIAKLLRVLSWRTSSETLEAPWVGVPELFGRSPNHLTVAPITSPPMGVRDVQRVICPASLGAAHRTMH
jgi:hypothetical protein